MEIVIEMAKEDLIRCVLYFLLGLAIGWIWTSMLNKD